MKKYFKVFFGEGKDREKNPLFVKATDMESIILWVLRNRPMKDYYGMNIVQVDPVTKESFSGADFYMLAVADYYRHEFPGQSDEQIRSKMIDMHTTALINRRMEVA